MTTIDQLTIETAEVLSIDLERDIQGTSRVPRVVTDSKGSPFQATEGPGFKYDFIRFDYLAIGGLVKAARMVARIQPSDRTELAFWSSDAPEKKLTIHLGMGALVIAQEGDRHYETERVGATTTSEVSLPPGDFYTIEADPNSGGPLVLSGYYEPPVESWGDLEIVVQPGSRFFNTPSSIMTVPEDFRVRYAT